MLPQLLGESRGGRFSATPSERYLTGTNGDAQSHFHTTGL